MGKKLIVRIYHNLIDLRWKFLQCKYFLSHISVLKHAWRRTIDETVRHKTIRTNKRLYLIHYAVYYIYKHSLLDWNKTLQEYTFHLFFSKFKDIEGAAYWYNIITYILLELTSWNEHKMMKVSKERRPVFADALRKNFYQCEIFCYSYLSFPFSFSLLSYKL